MVVRAYSEFPPSAEVQRQNRIALSLEEREGIVRQVVRVLAELERMGDSSAEYCRRLQLSEKLHRLAIPLWLDGPEDE